MKINFKVGQFLQYVRSFKTNHKRAIFVGDKHVPRSCDGVVGDCRHIPAACDPNASCLPGQRRGRITWHSCVCNEVKSKVIVNYKYIICQNKN